MSEVARETHMSDYGTSKGVPLTDELINHLSQEAETGYPIERMRSRKCNCFPHGPDEPCTCDGCWACKGHILGCTCDIAWDCEHGH